MKVTIRGESWEIWEITVIGILVTCVIVYLFSLLSFLLSLNTVLEPRCANGIGGICYGHEIGEGWKVHGEEFRVQ